MVFREQHYTLTDLREIEQRPENRDKTFELINGEIVEVNPPKPNHAYTADRFYIAFDRYAEQTGSGIAFSDSVGYDLPNGDSLIPDASFVAKSQVWFPLPDSFNFAPLVAVEVASPSNSGRELLDKAESFLECGTGIVWIAYPVTRVVDACHLTEDGSLIVRKMDINGTLDGEDVLPDFKLAVKDVFPPDTK